MSQKGSDDEKDREVKIDFDAFERQIDLEIDKLFIPSSGIPAQAGQPQEMGKEEEIPEILEMESPVFESVDTVKVEEELQAEARDREEPAELDLALQSSAMERVGAEIELPLPPPAAEPVELDELEIEHSLPDGSPGAELPEAQAHIPSPLSPPIGASEQAPRMHPTPQVSAQMESYQQMSAQSDQPDDDMDEPDRLIEAVDIAYLSLDWDFSAENIVALETAVTNLEPYWKGIHEATSIVKVMSAVLQHLKMRPNAITPPLIDFLADSVEFLKSLVQSEARPGLRERVQLKSLVDRLQSIKGGRSEAPKEGNVQMDLTAFPAVSASPGVHSPAAPLASASTEKLDGFAVSQLRELCEWMTSFRERSSEALQKLDEESKRLLQLEQTLGKKPALAPVTSRLTRVRSTMIDYIAAFRQSEQEWMSRVESLRQLERGAADMPSAPASTSAAVVPPAFPPPSTPFPAQEEVVLETVPTQEPPQPAAPWLSFAENMKEAIESRQEQVCLFQASGIRFALLAANVVKIEKLSDKKARKLISRGYATLEDFRPLFKNLRTGLLGSFSDLPARDLKSYRFLTLPHEMIRPVQMPSAGAPSASEVPSLVGGVILVSNMQYHGMIFTDPSGAEIHSETVEMRSLDGTTLGIIRTDSLDSVKVLNIDLILKNLNE